MESLSERISEGRTEEWFSLLPDEMILHVWKFLMEKDVGRLACVNRRFSILSRDPVLRKKLHRMPQICCGGYHTGVITSEGKLFLWGENVGAAKPRSCGGPAQVSISKSKYVSCGGYHTGAVTDEGKLYTWGWNYWGPLGLEASEDRVVPLPTLVKQLETEKIRVVSCGNLHTGVVTEKGEVYTWGSNEWGQLGLGHSETHVLLPSRVLAEGVRFQTISCGFSHTGVVTQEGKIWMWGSNRLGELGMKIPEGISENVSFPQEGPFIDGWVVRISCGYHNTGICTREGKVYMWGDNCTGKLGLGKSLHSSVPTPTVLSFFEGKPVVDLSCGRAHAGAVTRDGELYMWGDNIDGRLGFGDLRKLCVWVPTCVTRLKPTKIVSVSCGDYHTGIVTENGKIYTWGWNFHNQIGVGSPERIRSVPTPVSFF